ncbi:MAG: ATP-binding cassette domain-containing protein [Thermodesulfovibrionales bacterium]|nr:ATP-binding cassette domain-containing protein [Thermodesulfovibrionales bacterium]
MIPLLSVKGLTKIFGKGCSLCYFSTGPEYETNVCKYCKSVVACSNVSFDLYRGEVLGIVGESGSGKTTVIKILHFDLEPTSGEIYFNIPEARIESFDLKGRNLLLLTPYQKRQVRNSLMGIVYQDPRLGLRLEISSGGNIAERLIMANWRNIAKMRDRASELLKRTEMPIDRIDEPPRNFSGGMKQRVQIAKALSNNPLVLFLDEVTTGLDVSVQAKVLDLIKVLQREFYLSIIVVSHDLGVIRLLTKRTIVMKFGRIVESGLTDQILEDPQHPYTQILVSSQL